MTATDKETPMRRVGIAILAKSPLEQMREKVDRAMFHPRRMRSLKPRTRKMKLLGSTAVQQVLEGEGHSGKDQA